MENLGTKTQFQIQLSLKQPFQEAKNKVVIRQMGNMDFNLKDVKFLKKTTGIVVKSNKCNQCDFSCRPFEDTFENTQWREVEQMQPV